MVNFFLIFLNCQRLNMAEQYPSGLPLGCRNDEAIKDPQDNLKTFHVIHYPSNFRHAIKVIMAHMKHFWMVFVTQKLQNLSESPFQVLPQSIHKMAKEKKLPVLLTHFAISEPLAHLVKKENLFRRLQEGQVLFHLISLSPVYSRFFLDEILAPSHRRGQNYNKISAEILKKDPKTIVRGSSSIEKSHHVPL